MFTELINTIPDANDVWSGIGGCFDDLGQLIDAFIDNSISNFDANNPPLKLINISLTELTGEKIAIKIEDTGTGILDLKAAFTLGHGKHKPDSPLNEHGFGLKSALASANPRNDEWSLYTRTEEELTENKYRIISAPYILGDMKLEIIDADRNPWCGRYNSSGTIVTVTCSRELFNTLGRKRQGVVRTFNSLASLLADDIGFVYAGIIKGGRAFISLNSTDINGSNVHYPIVPVEPKWAEDFGPGKDTIRCNLGSGEVILNYHFGLIDSLDNRNLSYSSSYYQTNISNSGVEIRVNGRLICYNLFKEVWGIENHVIYNRFLVIIDIISDDLNMLPKTRTSKNGFREGEYQLSELYNWIRSVCIHPPRTK